MYYDITLAYACSVHKLQGSEYDNIILLSLKVLNDVKTEFNIYCNYSSKTNLYLIGEQRAFCKVLIICRKNGEQR